MKHQKAIFIVSPLRTPIGSFSGALAACSAPELGQNVVKEILKQTSVPAEAIAEVIMGCVLTAGIGQAPARQVALGAGLPKETQCSTINKVCSSGLYAVMLAARNVELGIAEAIIAGGMESMSNAPYLLPALRSGARLGHTEAFDSIVFDGLWDPYNNYHMGNAAELCAKDCNLSREAQDEFAIESYRRANEAIANGYFKDEIVPVTIQSRKGESIVDSDEEPGRGKVDKVSGLKPAFKKDGTVTAANASSINDGASGMLICSENFVKKHKLTPIAKLVAQGWYGQEPEWFTTAPIGATEQVLKTAGKKIADVDLFELNEAFSAVALACSAKLKIPADKLNINGGAVALGHPIGASGARILTTLLHALKRTGGNTGIAAICNGGGEATSVLVERDI